MKCNTFMTNNPQGVWSLMRLDKTRHLCLFLTWSTRAFLWTDNYANSFARFGIYSARHSWEKYKDLNNLKEISHLPSSPRTFRSSFNPRHRVANLIMYSNQVYATGYTAAQKKCPDNVHSPRPRCALGPDIVDDFEEVRGRISSTHLCLPTRFHNNRPQLQLWPEHALDANMLHSYHFRNWGWSTQLSFF